MKKKSSTMTAWTREEFLSRVGGGQPLGNPHQPEFSICQFVSFDRRGKEYQFEGKSQHKDKVWSSGSQSTVWFVLVMNLSRHGAERKEELVGNTSNKKTTPG